MNKFEELMFFDATAQAELVRKGEVQPIELVEAAIERIERINPGLNAVVMPMFEEARAQAKGKLPDGPFKGVPFLLKDLLAAYGGVRMTMGSVLTKDYVPDHHTELVLRFMRAGLIVLGKTNTPEFGILPTTEPRLFGPCRNPWDRGRTPGGSSGGSGAAVAAGLVPMAHGNDGGGSIRIPASCCGIFGLKPTRARNPLGPDFGDVMGGLVAEHALTRSVRDCATLLDATAGPDVGDPYVAPVPVRQFREEVGTSPGRLRIAFAAERADGFPLHPDCVAAVKDAASLCADLGHEVKEDSPRPNAERMIQAFTVVWSAGVASIMDGISYLTGKKPESHQVEPLTWALYQMGRGFTASDYILAISSLQQIAREVAHFFTDVDIWLSPTLGEPPVLLGTFDASPDNPMAAFARAAQFVPFTPICNVTGQPAMSVPLYWNQEGLPMGTHFVARFGEEATLFRLAGQLEEARPWVNRRPPV